MNLHQLKEKLNAIPEVKHVEFDYLDQIIWWIKMDISDPKSPSMDEVVTLLSKYKYCITAVFTNFKSK